MGILHVQLQLHSITGVRSDGMRPATEQSRKPDDWDTTQTDVQIVRQIATQVREPIPALLSVPLARR